MVEVGFDSAFVVSKIRVCRAEENQISFTLCTDVGEDLEDSQLYEESVIPT